MRKLSIKLLPGTGQKITCTNADTEYSCTVKPNGLYAVKAVSGDVLVGYETDFLDDDGDILFDISEGETLPMQIPGSVSTIYFGSVDAGSYVRLVKVENS